MGEQKRPDETAGTGEEPEEEVSPADAEKEAEAEANLLAKIAMTVYGHP